MTIKRMTFLQELLKIFGLDGRLHLEWISSAEAQKFVQVVTDFTEKIKALGPSPLAIFNQRIKDLGPKIGVKFDEKITAPGPIWIADTVEKINAAVLDSSVHGQKEFRGT